MAYHRRAEWASTAVTPTPEQATILAAGASSKPRLNIRSFAGTGKSATLLMLERASKTRPQLYLAFNRPVVDKIEFKARAEDPTKRVQSTTTVRSFNSLGHRVWAQAVNKHLTLDTKGTKKSQDLLRTIIDEVPKRDQQPLWDSYWDVVQGVAMAKAVGYVPEGKYPNARRLVGQTAFHASLDETPDDLTADLIDAVLTKSISAAYAGSIDYNDQVYMPALFGGTYPRFPRVMVDEEQDLNAVNHTLVERLVGPDTEFVGVGDPNQSIYRFRGAMQGGMDSITTKFKCEELPLTVSFRCPQAIVENVHWRVPTFQWSKPGGHVETLDTLHPNDIPEGAAILCRNNAPLFHFAMQLLSAHRPVQVAGSNIGPKLVGILRRLGEEDMAQASVLSAIDDWLAEKLAKGSATAPDLAAAMRVFAGHGANLGQAIRYAEHLFAQRGSIRLMTGHKAKGLEWETVYHLDSHLCRDTEQDMNLRYVIDTRSLDKLYYISSDGLQCPTT